MSTKPERIQYSKIALTVDGVQVHRAQRFGSSGDISREKLQELSNSGAVEWRSNIPVVSITMDTNDVGSTDTLALVADKMVYKALTDETNGPRGGIYRMFIKQSSANASTREIDEEDLLVCYCDFMVPISEDGTEITRAAWIHRAALTGLSWSYDVNGFASENYTFSSDNKRWFLNDWKSARVYKPHNVAQSSTDPANSATKQIWNNLDSAIPDGSDILFYCKNDQIYGNSMIDGMGANGTVEISTAGTFDDITNLGALRIATSGSTLDSAAATDNVHFVYLPPLNEPGITWERDLYSTAPGYNLSPGSTAFGGITRAYVAAYLYNTDGPFGETSIPSSPTLRLQTVNIDASFTEEQLLQLGYKRAYGVSRIDPVFTVSVTANDSDLDMFARMCATSDAVAKTISLDDFSGSNTLVIKAYKDESRSTLLRTVTISEMEVTGQNDDVSVGGNSVQEFTFTADNITVVGNDVSITGYDVV